MTAQRHCPCCGAPVVAATRLDALMARVRLSDQERDLLRLVARTPGLQGAVLADRLFSGRFDGGPLDGPAQVRVIALRLRRKLAPTGARFGALRGLSQGYFFEFGGGGA